jgi:hypothetical protein
MTARRLRHIFEPTLLRQRSTKVCSRLARRVDSATKPTSSSLHRSRVWFVAEAPLTPTIFGSPSRAQWGARSAMSSRSLCAEPITGTTIASETKSPGGEAGYRSHRNVAVALDFDAAHRIKTARGFVATRHRTPLPSIGCNDRACRSTVRSRVCADSSRQLELLRIRQFRAWLFETLYVANAALPDGLAESNESLSKLERYERRAFSRRKTRPARYVALRLELRGTYRVGFS